MSFRPIACAAACTQSGHFTTVLRCPLSEVKQTSADLSEMSAFPLRSNLVRRQQQTRLGIRNPVDKSDALQRPIEGLEAFHAEFDNNVPAAVGGVQRFARKWGYEVKGVPKDRAEVIVGANNFHGRTLTIVGFSTDATTRDGFGPFTPGFSRVVPFGDATALEAAITTDSVAFLVEPIQGEAGVIIPPAGYFKSVREICTRHNVILILDEIQTGLGRTGRLLAEEHEGIEADLTLIGKALSGGFYPVSAVLSNDEILGVLKPGEHGSTFGGNPLACAVARAALQVLIEEGMVENAYAMGARFLGGLRQINSPAVKEVRGRGLMIAIELLPQAGGARRYCDALRLRGVLCKDTHDHTIRVSPPLVITRDEIDWALDQFDAALRHPEAA